MAKKLDLLAVKALLQAEKASSLAAVNASTLVQERARALDYYNGKMSNEMPVEDGRSSAVSHDVSDTIEGLMPPLLEIFAGGEDVVKFNPVGPEDIETAEQETDYVNHVFLQQNEGFLVLYTFIKDALLEKVGIVKVWTEKTTQEKKENYYDQPDEAFAALASDKGVEIVAHTVRPDGLHDVEVVTKKDVCKHIVENIPPEQFGISRSAKTIKKANYCYHEVMKTESELIEAGYDEKQVKALPTWVLAAWSTGVEAIARDTVNESTSSGGDPGTNDATRNVKVTEHYVLMDYEGTGTARRYRVTTGGDQGEVLRRNGKEDIEEVEHNPFAAASPIIMPHRFFGKSIADLVIDIQKIKTALVRGKLDNLYLHNNPRVEVAETFASENTLDDLLVSRPGGIVRTKQPGGLQWQVVPDITTSIYPALEYWDATREWRTGVTRQGQGIDANALQNQTATAVNQTFTAAQARMKLIARIFAETGIRDLFSLLHAEIRKYGDQAQTVRLRNKWVSVNPRDWKERNDVTITVGLGTGSKTEFVQHLMGIINLQAQAMQAGKTNLVDDAKLFNSAKELTKLLEYKDPTVFFNDPNEKDENGQLVHPPAQPQPPESVLVAQIKAQTDQQKMGVQAQLDERADQRKAQIEAVQAQADMATQDKKNANEAALKQQDFQLKRELALLQAALEREKFEREEARKEREHALSMQQSAEQHRQQMEAGVFKTMQGQEAHSQKLELAEHAAKAKPKGDK